MLLYWPVTTAHFLNASERIIAFSESTRRRMLLAIRHEHIAAAAPSLDEARNGRIVFEDTAKTPHLHIDATVRSIVFRFVQQVDQALSCDRSHRVVDKDPEQCGDIVWQHQGPV